MPESLKIELRIICTATLESGWLVDIENGNEKIQSDVKLTDPLTPEQTSTCSWYLEQYSQSDPFAVGKANEAESLLNAYPNQLLSQLNLRDAVSAYHDEAIRSLHETLLFINVYQDETGSEQNVKHDVHQLLWETLEDPALWSYTHWRVIVSRSWRACQQEDIILTQKIDTMPHRTNALNVLLVVARDLSQHPSVYNDVDPNVATSTLLQLRDRLKTAFHGMELNLEVVRPGTWDAFKDHLMLRGRNYFHLVHFDLHGSIGTRAKKHTKYGLLYFAQKDGDETTPVPCQRVGKQLGDYGVPLIVMNSCESANASQGYDANLAKQFLDKGVQGVLGMSFKIVSSAAALFLEHFYTALMVHRCSLAESAAFGRRALRINPARPSRYGLERRLKDYFVAVSYSNRKDHLHIPTMRLSATRSALSIPQLFDGKPGGIVASEVQGPIGREFDILRLEKLLVQGRVVYLYGVYGVGKTSLIQLAIPAWKKTKFIEAVVTFNCTTPEDLTASSFLCSVLRQLLSQVNHTHQSRFWTIPSENLESSDEEMMDKAILDIISTSDVLIVINGLMPSSDIFSFSTNDKAVAHIGGIISSYMSIAKVKDRPKRCFVVISERRSNPNLIGQRVNHLFGEYCYELKGLDFPDAIELSTRILKAAGEPVSQWKSEDASWLDSIVQLLQGIPSTLLDILPLQQSLGIPWRHFFAHLHGGIFKSRSQLRQSSLENSALVGELSHISRFYNPAHSFLLFMLSTCWHEALPLEHAHWIFKKLQISHLQRDFYHGKDDPDRFWITTFYAMMHDRGYVYAKTGPNEPVIIHPTFSVVGRAFFSDCLGLGNRVQFKAAFCTALTDWFGRQDVDGKVDATTFQSQTYNILTAANYSAQEIPIEQWPLSVLTAFGEQDYAGFPPSLRHHLLDRQLEVVDAASRKIPLLDNKADHLYFFAIILYMHLMHSPDTFRDCNKIANLSQKGLLLLASSGNDDALDKFNFSSAYLLLTSILSLEFLGKHSEACIKWKELEGVRPKLDLPPQANGVLFADLAPLETTNQMEYFEAALAALQEIPQVHLRLLIAGLSLASLSMSGKYKPLVDALDEENISLEMYLDAIFYENAPFAELGMTVGDIEHIYDLIQFDPRSLPSVSLSDVAARSDGLETLELTYDTGDWELICQKHAHMVQQAAEKNQFDEALIHLNALRKTLNKAAAPEALLSAVERCESRLSWANAIYVWHNTIFPSEYFDRGYGVMRPHEWVKEYTPSAKGVRASGKFALLWPHKDEISEKDDTMAWHVWWKWIHESQGQDASWISRIHLEDARFEEERKLLQTCFLYVARNDLEQAHGSFNQLETVCNEGIFMLEPPQMSPLHMIRDCIELAWEQHKAVQYVVSTMAKDFEANRVLIEDLALLRPRFCSWMTDKSIQGFHFALEKSRLIRFQAVFSGINPVYSTRQVQEQYQLFVRLLENGEFSRLQPHDVLSVRHRGLEKLVNDSIESRLWREGMKYCDEYFAVSDSFLQENPKGQEDWILGRQKCEWSLTIDSLTEAENEQDFDKCLDNAITTGVFLALNGYMKF
ncbi:unnamed protein product [Clonostachys solani]|uniref:CHAT domain-containing protein n=1 Tax=Clonostachys solani TaxID=160281 RepID=A0A9N9Z097_9HYPO|nr:unnamed protein product [Clonostachys solani]